ncbi:MAG: hypothetical protein KAR40_09600 [Candidatus Sabulitectum sp.]|nr:hypothetical protein [Candidatus Sabulitectum sp.]
MKITKKLFGSKGIDLDANGEVVSNGHWLISLKEVDNAAIFTSAKVARQALNLKDTTTDHEINEKMLDDMRKPPEDAKEFKRTDLVYTGEWDTDLAVYKSEDGLFLYIKRLYADAFKLDTVLAKDMHSTCFAPDRWFVVMPTRVHKDMTACPCCDHETVTEAEEEAV